MTEVQSYPIMHKSNQHSLTELRVVCIPAEVWEKLTCQTRGLIRTHCNHSWKVKISHTNGHNHHDSMVPWPIADLNFTQSDQYVFFVQCA